MKGKINYRADRNYWYVDWYHGGERYRINKYKGYICRDGVLQGLTGEDMAKRTLALMQSDVENRVFKIEKYTQQTTDVVPFLREWLQSQKPTLSPATYKDYYNSIENHLVPWFSQQRFQLHEIQYDILCMLLNDIKRESKGKMNVMYCLRAALGYAWKSGKILNLPPFPEKRLYGIVKKKPKWIPEARQVKIIEAIPKEHQPIFWWLKYHLRRPSEAMALFKEDYDSERDVFVIRRTFSNKKMVEYTKTHVIHEVPCHPMFQKILAEMPTTLSPFFFVNPHGRLEGKHYQHDYLVDLWNKARDASGEIIGLYRGTKHSSCSQFINEHGGTIDELQMLTDHARRESVLQYADVEIERKRELMGRVYRMKEVQNEGD